MPAWLAGQWRLLLTAVQFLTRLPVGAGHPPEPLHRAVRYFPLVGAGVDCREDRLSDREPPALGRQA